VTVSDEEYSPHSQLPKRFYLGYSSYEEQFQTFETNFRTTYKFKCEKKRLHNVADNTKVTPMHLTVMLGIYDNVRFLLEYCNALPILRDLNNLTPKDLAKLLPKELHQIYHLLEHNEKKLKDHYDAEVKGKC
jgi:hypothetical protein